jgi:hypothetical protein
VRATPRISYGSLTNASVGADVDGLS